MELLNKIAILSLLAVLLSACGAGPQSDNSPAVPDVSAHVDPVLYDTNDSSLARYLSNLNAIPVPPESDDDNDVPRIRYQTTLDFKFKQLAKVLEFSESATHKALWPVTDCDRVGTGSDLRSAKKQYRCGEVPYGDIVSSTLKKVFEFKFTGLKGEKSGVKYKVDSAEVPIYLERRQRPNQDSIDHLTSKGQKQVKISNDILDSVYYRFYPQDGHLISNVCVFLPGLAVRSERKEINVEAEKRLLFLKFNADAKIKVSPG